MISRKDKKVPLFHIFHQGRQNIIDLRNCRAVTFHIPPVAENHIRIHQIDKNKLFFSGFL